MTETDLHDVLARAAFRYALRSVAVFPLAPGAKVPPKGSHGLTDASDNHDVTRARWQRCRGANIGAATGAPSGFWVLDVDPDHDGDRSLADLEAVHGPLPATIEASTPSGGRHLYWKWVLTEPEMRNSAGRVGKGLDVRGNGGQIVLPPSVLRDGRGYAWRKNGTTAFADAPDWLLAATLPPPEPPRREPGPPPKDVERYVSAAAADELAKLAQAQEGARNDTLNRAAFALAGFVLANALPEDWTRSQLEARGKDIGLPIHEVRRTIDSAFRKASARELPR